MVKSNYICGGCGVIEQGVENMPFRNKGFCHASIDEQELIILDKPAFHNLPSVLDTYELRDSPVWSIRNFVTVGDMLAEVYVTNDNNDDGYPDGVVSRWVTLETPKSNFAGGVDYTYVGGHDQIIVMCYNGVVQSREGELSETQYQELQQFVDGVFGYDIAYPGI